MNESFAHKLAQFAPPPPEAAWEKIAAALDETPAFADRLYQYETTPPSAVWAAVEKALDEPRKSASVFTVYRTPLRYLAAASVIAALLVAATFLLKPSAKQNAGGNAVVTTPSKPNQNDGIVLNTPKPDRNESVAAAEPDEEETAQEQTVSTKHTPHRIRTRSLFSSLSFTRAFIPRQAEEQALVNSKSSDELMVYTDGEGLALKLPKKLFSLVNCRDGDGTCKERIRQLQQKMASNTAAPDFTGMLDLLRQLQ